MKKIISVILAIFMIASITTVAFATEAEPEDEVVSEAIVGVAAEDEAEDSEAEDDGVYEDGEAFISVYLGTGFEDTAFVLYENGEAVKTCVADDAGMVKFTINTNAGPYHICQNGVAPSEIADEEPEPDSVTVKFCFGESFAGKTFYFMEGANAEPFELTADAEGAITMMAGNTYKYTLTYSNLIEAEDGTVLSVETAESLTSNEQEVEVEEEKDSNLGITIAFFVLLALAVGYLVYDKFFRNRQKKESNDAL